ncbi:hypothetical protein KOW79_019990 [Hemibagrus wyckioides]|uniref:Uncharacterized protein n=1 Tax=Hemibagrus wyckioides TaxID=337641 RepID=A0A9D3N5R8_9TELE|nr:hypothetical protein KOW79_019990 [Hemibagrus wyckioides]
MRAHYRQRALERSGGWKARAARPRSSTSSSSSSFFYSSSELLLVLMLFGHVCAAADARAALPFVFTRPRAGVSSDTCAKGILTQRCSISPFRRHRSEPKCASELRRRKAGKRLAKQTSFPSPPSSPHLVL